MDDRLVAASALAAIIFNEPDADLVAEVTAGTRLLAPYLIGGLGRYVGVESAGQPLAFAFGAYVKLTTSTAKNVLQSFEL